MTSLDELIAMGRFVLAIGVEILSPHQNSQKKETTEVPKIGDHTSTVFFVINEEKLNSSFFNDVLVNVNNLKPEEVCDTMMKMIRIAGLWLKIFV
jgi:hypothetical protein